MGSIYISRLGLLGAESDFCLLVEVMGLLTEGKPLSWADTKKNAALVHKVGIQQFLALYHRLKDRKGDVLKWGDEVSC